MVSSLLPDFAARLALGLSGSLLCVPRQLVPVAFMRTLCLVVLALLVIVALFSSSATVMTIAILAAVLAYFGSIGWGLGLIRIGIPAIAGVVVAITVLLIEGLLHQHASPVRSWNSAELFAGGVSSAALLGSTLTAMMLGHYYLTAPAMSISPLRRFVGGMAVALFIRTIMALPGLIAWWRGNVVVSMPADTFSLFLTLRWGVGLASAGLATWMAWRTVLIRSTQSATGILYIAMTLVLFGELMALVLTAGTGIAF